MSVSAKLKQFLDDNNIKYTFITHSRAYTAQEVAAAMHVPGKELAKTVVVKLDGRFALAVLPAPYRISLDLLKAIAGANEAALASESEFKDLFPDCELGAMPPFGNLYNLPVYVDESLEADDEIVFNAGSHTDAIRMKFADFVSLAKPTIASFGKLVT